MIDLKKFVVSGLLALGLLVSLAACQPSLTAQQILDNAVQAVNNVDTASLDMTMSLDMGGISLTITGSGFSEPPDKAYFTMGMSFFGESFTMEALRLSPDELYMKTSEDSEWIPSTTEEASQLFDLGNLYENLGSDSTGQPMEGLKIEGVEKINGINCYKLTAEEDLSALLDSMLSGLDEGMDAQMESGSGSIIIYIATGTFLPQKLEFIMEFTITTGGTTAPVTIEGVVDYHDYNQPVHFPKVGHEK